MDKLIVNNPEYIKWSKKRGYIYLCEDVFKLTDAVEPNDLSEIFIQSPRTNITKGFTRLNLTPHVWIWSENWQKYFMMVVTKEIWDTI